MKKYIFIFLAASAIEANAQQLPPACQQLVTVFGICTREMIQWAEMNGQGAQVKSFRDFPDAFRKKLLDGVRDDGYDD